MFFGRFGNGSAPLCCVQLCCYRFRLPVDLNKNTKLFSLYLYSSMSCDELVFLLSFLQFAFKKMLCIQSCFTIIIQYLYYKAINSYINSSLNSSHQNSFTDAKLRKCIPSCIALKGQQVRCKWVKLSVDKSVLPTPCSFRCCNQGKKRK